MPNPTVSFSETPNIRQLSHDAPEGSSGGRSWKRIISGAALIIVGAVALSILFPPVAAIIGVTALGIKIGVALPGAIILMAGFYVLINKKETVSQVEESDSDSDDNIPALKPSSARPSTATPDYPNPYKPSDVDVFKQTDDLIAQRLREKQPTQAPVPVKNAFQVYQEECENAVYNYLQSKSAAEPPRPVAEPPLKALPTNKNGDDEFTIEEMAMGLVT